MYERRGRGGFGRGGSGGGFRGDRDFDKPKPVKVGEEYDVEISDVGAKGDGITKVENFIIFVPDTKKGEKCKIKIKEVANKFAIGEKVGEASEEAEEEKEAKYGEEASEDEATEEESKEEESKEEEAEEEESKEEDEEE